MPPEADHVDRVRGDRQPVRGTDPDDRLGTETLAQSGDVALQSLVGRGRRHLAPYDIDKSRHGHGFADRQGQGGQHRPALSRSDVDRVATVRDGPHPAQELDLHRAATPSLAGLAPLCQ